jgi:hypothetical protein
MSKQSSHTVIRPDSVDGSQSVQLPVAESAAPVRSETQLSATQPSVIPETTGRESFVPETPYPLAGPSTNGVQTIGDGTMPVEEAGQAGPSSFLGDITQSVSKAISSLVPAIESALPILHSTAGASAPNGPSGYDTAGTGTRVLGSNAVASSSTSANPSAVLDTAPVPIRYSSPAPPTRPRTYRTGYIYDATMMLHCVDGYEPTDEHVEDAGEGHPEEPMRIKRIYHRLREAGLLGRMKMLAFEQVSFEQVMLVHNEEHWFKVEGTQGQFCSSDAS